MKRKLKRGLSQVILLSEKKVAYSIVLIENNGAEVKSYIDDKKILHPIYVRGCYPIGDSIKTSIAITESRQTALWVVIIRELIKYALSHYQEYDCEPICVQNAVINTQKHNEFATNEASYYFALDDLREDNYEFNHMVYQAFIDYVAKNINRETIYWDGKGSNSAIEKCTLYNAKIHQIYVVDPDEEIVPVDRHKFAREIWLKVIEGKHQSFIVIKPKEKDLINKIIKTQNELQDVMKKQEHQKINIKNLIRFIDSVNRLEALEERSEFADFFYAYYDALQYYYVLKSGRTVSISQEVIDKIGKMDNESYEYLYHSKMASFEKYLEPIFKYDLDEIKNTPHNERILYDDIKYKNREVEQNDPIFYQYRAFAMYCNLRALSAWYLYSTKEYNDDEELYWEACLYVRKAIEVDPLSHENHLFWKDYGVFCERLLSKKLKDSYSKKTSKDLFEIASECYRRSIQIARKKEELDKNIFHCLLSIYFNRITKLVNETLFDEDTSRSINLLSDDMTYKDLKKVFDDVKNIDESAYLEITNLNDALLDLLSEMKEEDVLEGELDLFCFTLISLRTKKLIRGELGCDEIDEISSYLSELEDLKNKTAFSKRVLSCIRSTLM